MKYIVTLVLISLVSFSLNAQKENCAFLEIRAMEMMNQESNNLEQTISSIENALTQKDNSLMGSNKSSMLKSIKRIANTSNTMAAQVKSDRVLIATKQNILSDYSEGLMAYKRYKSSPSRLKEVKIDGAGDVFLTENAEKIQKLWSKIQSNNLEFHPSQKNSVANLKSAKEILATVQEFNSLIRSGVISE